MREDELRKLGITLTCKYSAAGNTFVVVDATKTALNDMTKEKIVLEVVEDRDGVIFVEQRSKRFFMDYFNRDGKRATFCGNGARAFLKFLSEYYDVFGEVSMETNAGVLKGYIGEKISVQMPDPVVNYFVPQEELSGFEGIMITVGVPHLVMNVGKAIWGFDMEIARLFRYKFNANVNLFNVLDSSTFEIRTFERGVERETLSCGSGTTATAYFVKYYILRDNKIPDKLTAQTKGGILNVIFESDGIYLEGGVEHE
ncbi:diaminopimelate epimerase [Fervidobacterium sp.]